jgi:hypothetical protein
MPRLPPVTKATLPSKEKSIFHLLKKFVLQLAVQVDAYKGSIHNLNGLIRSPFR